MLLSPNRRNPEGFSDMLKNNIGYDVSNSNPDAAHDVILFNQIKPRGFGPGHSPRNEQQPQRLGGKYSPRVFPMSPTKNSILAQQGAHLIHNIMSPAGLKTPKVEGLKGFNPITGNVRNR